MDFDPISVAQVTGASGGLGYDYAKLLAADGHDLVLVARSEDKLEEIKKELEAKHGVNVKVIPKGTARLESLTDHSAVHIACFCHAER
jgi:short-subunit dehydrogenase